MGKAPAFQFYVKDWLSDPALQMASSSSRGIWINALCHMWVGCDADVTHRGKLTGTQEELCKILGCVTHELDLFLEEIKRLKFGNVTFGDNNVTLINRRMVREQRVRDNTRLRMQKHRRYANVTHNVTPSSPSPSPISKKIYIADEDFLRALKEKYTWLNFDQELTKIDSWLLANPGRQKTRRFIVNWLNKIQRPLQIQSPQKKEIPNPEIIPQDFKPDPNGQKRIKELIDSISKKPLTNKT